MVAAITNPLIQFDTPPAAPSPNDLAADHSLLTLDQELDLLLDQIEDEIEESGEASKETMDRLQMFSQAMNVKVDRIGRYLSVIEVRAEHCKQEAARYAQRAKRAQSKIDRTKSMVLYVQYIRRRHLDRRCYGERLCNDVCRGGVGGRGGGHSTYNCERVLRQQGSNI
jgi:hypothetical protein